MNWFIIFSCLMFAAQSFPQARLDKYIRQGLADNIVLRQKTISYQKATYALKTATTYFFPTVTLKADYTSGEGGRAISIPIGDIMNPVYNTLNMLTQSNAFPQISNVEQDFFPYKFYDVKFRASMPLLNSDIYFNREINKNKEQISTLELSAYKRDLVKEIKSAYYNYLSAVNAVKIYESAMELASEGKRTNEKLLENGVGLPVYILRSESEIENVRSQIAEAKSNKENAKQYFNFLLNRSPEDEILTDTEEQSLDLPLTQPPAQFVREELYMLNAAVDINRSLLSMKRFNWIPKINAFVDYGAQDQVWNMKKQSRYYLFGFMLEVPLFESFRNTFQTEESELSLKFTELELEKTAKQLELSKSMSINKLEAARQNYNSTLKQEETAAAYHRLINKGYREGINSFIETVDARTQLTQVRLLLNINKYKYLTALAEFEREAAALDLNQYK
ncbi:MAG: TolC family protein [Ignavibacteriaceae bacterium]|nr:TolC family protein [Ignavibacteriaceae bacterium]